MEQKINQPPAKFGLVGFLLAIAALVVVLIQLSVFFEPPEKSNSVVIGEIAAEIKQAAARAFTGAPAPEQAPAPQDHTQLFTNLALCVAGIAVILGGIGLYRNEPSRLSYLAIGIGISALVMQYAFWLAVLICGVVLLISIIENLGSIFD